MIKTARSLRRVVRNSCQYSSEGSIDCEDVGSMNRSAGLAAGDVARVSDNVMWVLHFEWQVAQQLLQIACEMGATLGEVVLCSRYCREFHVWDP